MLTPGYYTHTRLYKVFTIVFIFQTSLKFPLIEQCVNINIIAHAV